MKSLLLKELQQELKENIYPVKSCVAGISPKVKLFNGVNEKYRADNQKYHKEKIFCYGVRTPIVRKIAKKYFKQIKHLDKNQTFALCEALFKNRYNEEATIAIQWVNDIQNQFSKADFKIFENWLAKYIDNWAKCDNFCLYIIYPIIEKYPELIGKVKLWSYSKNIWLRRALAVSFITVNKGSYVTKHNLKDILEVAQLLLNDKEDLVQKGYGWMLKATSIHNQKEVFEFVMKNKDIMPRTALRYAIEKMPANLKKQAMQKIK